MHGRVFTSRRVIMGPLERDRDLLAFLEAVAVAHGVRTGAYSFFGAVRRARVAFFDQEARVYRSIVLDRPLEIAAGVGNVSLRDGRPFVHAHVVLSGPDGTALGGHLEPDTIIFAGEFTLWDLDGAPLERSPDPDTGLLRWPAR